MENQQPDYFEDPQRAGVGKLPLIIAIFCVSALAIGMWVREHQQSEAFDAERARMTANLNQAVSQSKSEIQALTNRIDLLTAAQARPEPVQQPSQPPRAVRATGKVASKARRKPGPLVAKDPRVDALQGQLADTQKELAKTRDELSGQINSTRDDLNGSIARTQDDVAKTRDALTGQINSTRDDLNGSIAKTHDEVVALRKRGEQNIYEFRLDKSKQFQRVGPLSVSLRSANVKHKTYDLAMIIEDNQLSKKHVNLYEPVWIRLTDRPQAVELVVNRVDKDRIAGYISEPKYKKSELASVSEKAVEKPQQLESR